MLFAMQGNQVLCSRQLLKQVTISMSAHGCTGIMAVDVRRIELEGGVEITHQNHLVLLRHMI